MTGVNRMTRVTLFNDGRGVLIKICSKAVRSHLHFYDHDDDDGDDNDDDHYPILTHKNPYMGKSTYGNLG